MIDISLWDILQAFMAEDPVNGIPFVLHLGYGLVHVPG
jgi:hypothetical protein